MSQIATVEMIYVAHSGRQYRAKYVQVHVGWELEDLEQKAKSALSLRDYAIDFVNANGHKQFIMPKDLETIIVNVVSVAEERWEEPAYEELQQKWSGQLAGPYGDPEQKPDPVSAPTPISAVMVVPPKPKQQPRRNPVQPVTRDGETTRSLRITWPQDLRAPQQRVNRPDSDSETTQPIKIIQGKVAGMPLSVATALIERVAAGGALTPGV